MEQDGETVMTALVRTAADTTGHTHDVTTHPDRHRAGRRRTVPLHRPRQRALHVLGSLRATARRQDLEYDIARAADSRVDPLHPTAKFADPFIDAARPLLMLDTLGYFAARQKYPARFARRTEPRHVGLVPRHRCAVRLAAPRTHQPGQQRRGDVRQRERLVRGRKACRERQRAVAAAIQLRVPPAVAKN